MASNYYESKTPHFFKVIVEEDLQKNSLIVPSKFARKYGKNLSSLVHLKVPTGDVSAVQLERNHDGVLSLHNGWADFMDRCCIRFGYLLVFRYEGDSLFHVVVFDVTACEIEYPVSLGNGKMKPLMDSDEEREEVFQSAESSDDEYLEACATPLSHLRFSSRGMAKTGEKEAGVIEELSHDQGFDAYADGGRKKPLLQCRRSPKKLRTEPRATDLPKAESDDSSPEREFSARAATANESGAFQRAASFHSEGPSAIVLVGSLQRLYLPKKLLMRCFPDRGEYRDIKVCLTDGRTWTFRIGEERRFPRFGRGWHKFVVDNHLRTGDVCLFELIASAEADFRVFIFQEGVERPCSLPTRRRMVSSQENAARESASHEGSQRLNDCVKLDSGREIHDPYPSFHVVVGKSFEKPLHIKKSFAERHLKGILGEVDVNGTLECGGNSWPCKLCCYKSRGRRETVLRGWQEFQRENEFKVGHSLLIQLLNRENGFVFRVSNL